MKVLVHTPVSNRAWVLPRFWAALRGQTALAGVTGLMRFDINDCQDETFDLVQAYCSAKDPFETVFAVEHQWPALNLESHAWNEERYYRMIAMRNAALRTAAEYECDFLFSVDSDVILRDPNTLGHLLLANVPIIAGVFKSRWGNPDAPALPNVWQRGQNEMTERFLDDILTAPEHERVGGVGACTLIRNDVWNAGVTYNPIFNVPSNYRGEDRFFSLRAAVAGFEMWACSHKQIDHLDGKEALLTQERGV